MNAVQTKEFYKQRAALFEYALRSAAWLLSNSTNAKKNKEVGDLLYDIVNSPLDEARTALKYLDLINP